MNPRELFCPNMDCPARGQVGKGNIHTHSRKEKRCTCKVCGQTFTTTAGTIFYRLRHAPELVIQVITLLAYGCTIQAIVKALGQDERTVGDWHRRAGQHCQQIHEHLVESSQPDLQQVQADDTCTCMQVQVNQSQNTARHVLDGLSDLGSDPSVDGRVVSPKRDLDLIQALADKVRNMALCRPLLLAVDGLASYVSAFRIAFRSKFPRREGETGRYKMISWPDIAIVQVVKQRVEGVLPVERRIVQGAKHRIEWFILTTQGQGVINTAFMERLNATFRQRVNSLTRRTRTLAQQVETLVAGLYLVGCFYNFCDFHHSLRLKLSVGSFGHHWVQRTPAIASGLTDHSWTPIELFHFEVPPPRWDLPKRRGRPSTTMLQLAQHWVS